MYEPSRAHRSTHIPALDGIRGIAILLVLGIHFFYSGAFPQLPPRFAFVGNVFAFGWMGVDLFFVLSGFLITGILLDTAGAPNYFQSFYARRTLRIFPVYYLVIAVFLCILPFASRSVTLGLFLPGSSLLTANLFYLQNWWICFHGWAKTGVIGDYWSLGIEEQFYLVWPFVVLKLSRQNLTVFCVMTCVFAPFLRLLLLQNYPRSTLVFASTITRTDTLLWGALVAIAIRTPGLVQKAKSYLSPILLTTALFVLIIDFPLGELYSRALITQSIGYTIIAIGFAAFLFKAYLVDGTSSRLASFLHTGLLRSFGRYSYGIYIYHGFLIVAMKLVFGRAPWFGHSIPGAVVLFFVFFASNYGVAYISFHVYEKNFLALKSRFKASGSHIPLFAAPLTAMALTSSQVEDLR